jgi:hypothetical protein
MGASRRGDAEVPCPFMSDTVGKKAFCCKGFKARQLLYKVSMVLLQ